jgi:hypothetical protein
VPGERTQHEDSLAFLKVVVFHQEMDISSLSRRLLAVHTASDDPFSSTTALELLWHRIANAIALPVLEKV